MYFYHELYFIYCPQDREKASLQNIAILKFCILGRQWLKTKYSQSGAAAATITVGAVTVMTTAATTYTVVIKFKNDMLHIYNCPYLKLFTFE
jgi:hypothetical protein